VDGRDKPGHNEIRHAAEYTPSAKTPDDVEKTPVFDRAGVALKI
jgi:hypothetical protein